MTVQDPAMPCITAVTPTICSVMNVPCPSSCNDAPLSTVLDTLASDGQEPVEKCLVFAADAIGLWMVRKYAADFVSVAGHAPLAVELRSVVPPKTPVCYASMFTGAQPDVHGIQAYVKPVVAIETMFDALVAGGKKVAIVATPNSSINKIFRERPLDYYVEPYDEEVVAQAQRLLLEGRHDFILVYNQRYDDVMHKTLPESPQALDAMRQVVANFDSLCKAVAASPWRNCRRLVLFAPDHGAHISDDGVGTHGKDIPEDMLVQHYFGFHDAKG